MSTQGVGADRVGLVRALVAAARPHQWTKNLLVFAALVFARKFLDAPMAARALAAFVIFCAASAAAYLLNDVCDAERDRKHPAKRLRPVASGALPAGVALGAAAALAALAAGAGLLLGADFGIVVVAYLVLQLAYSLALKHVVIVDALCIAASFVLRADAGALVLGVEFSNWLMLCTGLLALFLALAKRRYELVETDDAVSHRRSLAHYSPDMLDQMIAAVAGATIVAYALYTMSPRTVGEVGSDSLKYTIPFVVYGLFRYLYLVYWKREGGSPARHLLADRPLLVAVFLYALASALILALTGKGIAP